MTAKGYLRAFAAAVAAVLVGCAGNGPAPCGTGTQFDNIQCNIFNVSCISGGCHNQTDQAGSLVLTQGESCGQLVNVLSVNATAAAMGLLRVQPFNPNNSFLIIKLTGPGAGEGGRMPLNAAPLSSSQINTISQWIADGAICNTTPSPTPSATATLEPSPTETASPTETESPTVTETPTVTATVPTPTGTLPATATPTQTPTVTPTLPATPTPSDTPTVAPTATPTFDPAATLTRIQDTIFTPKCLFGGCHNANDHSGNLTLVAGQSFAQLVNHESDNLAARDAGLLRVQPFDPDNSFLFIKVTNPTIPEGARMPQGFPPLSADEVQLISTWIAQGALE